MAITVCCPSVRSISSAPGSRAARARRSTFDDASTGRKAIARARADVNSQVWNELVWWTAYVSRSTGCGARDLSLEMEVKSRPMSVQIQLCCMGGGRQGGC